MLLGSSQLVYPNQSIPRCWATHRITSYRPPRNFAIFAVYTASLEIRIDPGNLASQLLLQKISNDSHTCRAGSHDDGRAFLVETHSHEFSKGTREDSENSKKKRVKFQKIQFIQYLTEIRSHVQKKRKKKAEITKPIFTFLKAARRSGGNGMMRKKNVWR